jgi:HEPN domain-containing protein
MMRDREAIALKVLEWVSVAEEDLRLACLALEVRRRCPHRMIAYHAQQCAEKYLKAFFVWRRKDFPFTHNLARLREYCGECASWAADLVEAEELSVFAVTARYPGEAMKVSKTDAIESVNIASAAWCAKRCAMKGSNYESRVDRRFIPPFAFWGNAQRSRVGRR